MSYKKNSASNRDALFGAPSSGPKHKRDAAANRNDLFAGANKNSKSSSNSSRPATSRPTAPPPAAVPASSKGYNAGRKKKTMANVLSGDAKAAKLQQAQDFRDKANKCMQKSFLNKPDPVAASTYFKRAADAYQQCGEEYMERLYRIESAKCNLQVGAWASAAGDYTRAAELMLDAEDVDKDTKRKEASDYHKKAAEAWTQMNEKSKAAASQIQAAIALNYGDESRLLSKEALAGMEEAVEAHVPDVFNPYARYRQTGYSAFIDPESEETISNPSTEALAMAEEHMVTRAYAHEPLQELTYVLINYGEYASALYACGAATTILEKDGLSTLSLSRAFATETILTLAMGDPVAAEQNFLNRHVQKTAYLTSRECKLSEDLFRAIKMRDPDELEEARSITGSNKAALANLHESLRELVQMLRLSGVARRRVDDTTTGSGSNKPSKKRDGQAKKAVKEPSLEEVLSKPTGYEKEVEQGKNLNTDELHAELDALDFGGLDDSEDEDNGGNDDDFLDDDDIDLR